MEEGQDTEEGHDASRAPCAALNRKKAALDFALEGEITNPHLAAFAATPLRRALLEDARFDYWRRYSRCKKELIESWAALEQLRRCVRRLFPSSAAAADAGAHRTGAGLVFVELCSGRGCLSMLLAHEFPDATIHMCDADARMKLTHLTHPSMRNVTFHLEDVFTDEAKRTVVDAVAKAERDGGKCLVVGVHLCGDLARRAVELWRATGAHALVLCPCCLPRRRRADAFGFHVVDQARKMRVDSYALWCVMLYGLAAAPGDGDEKSAPGDGDGEGAVYCNLCVDEDVTSPQRSFITAVRRARGGRSRGGGVEAARSRGGGVVPGRGAGKWRIVDR